VDAAAVRARWAPSELVAFGTLLTMMLVLVVAAVGTGGPTSPVLPWFLAP